MNDIEFRQRAFTNPGDDSPEFRAAIAESAQRRQLVDELLALDSALRENLTVPAPEGLKARLLNPEKLPSQNLRAAPAANESGQWKKFASIAASMVLVAAAVFTGFSFWAGSADQAFADEVMQHLYSEIEFLSSANDLSPEQVNQIMARADVNVRLIESADDPELEKLKMTGATDCWILKNDDYHLSMHMVMEGDRGTITVMVIPSSPVSEEMLIADDRFDGIITPTAAGNLVVIGEKQEPVAQVKNILANKIDWEY